MNRSMESQQLSSKAHILVVDDDQRIRELVSRYLWDKDFIVMEAESAADARDAMDRFQFDALVLDVMMPGETGIELTQSLNHDGKNIPILLLTALGEVEDRINGLESGADDYLAKPFEPRELLARLNAILRRTAKPVEALKPFKIGDLTFDPKHNELCGTNSLISLTSVEATLLRALAKHAGETVSREELAELCDLDAGERTIDVQVTRLRRKIEKDTRNPRYLQTVRGKGYLLRIEDV